MKDFPKLMFFAGLLFVSGEGHCSDPVRDSIYLLELSNGNEIYQQKMIKY